ncbi:hypothetical protein EOD39_12928 [Acipenser ruthenus]|uniref:SCAN box domain-containing protein n=1 Tax=Acipenser ruthenus TaxID=7906 RepID=A0A444UJX4_ACIRT|nr:hypothetical protein EOD39_12928 [Acipenser ruthenus]
MRATLFIVELIVLDQFQQGLPKEVRPWVEQNNTKTADQLVALVERYFTAASINQTQDPGMFASWLNHPYRPDTFMANQTNPTGADPSSVTTGVCRQVFLNPSSMTTLSFQNVMTAQSPIQPSKTHVHRFSPAGPLLG